MTKVKMQTRLKIKYESETNWQQCHRQKERPQTPANNRCPVACRPSSFVMAVQADYVNACAVHDHSFVS